MSKFIFVLFFIPNQIWIVTLIFKIQFNFFLDTELGYVLNPKHLGHFYLKIRDKIQASRLLVLQRICLPKYQTQHGFKNMI